MSFVITAVLSYLIGSIPNGLIIGKVFKGVDIREFGSKNIGATNAYRVLGAWPGFFVLIMDLLKGVIAVYIGKVLIGTTMGEITGAFFAITGHNWPVFLGFKGGRGVATALGVIAILMPRETAIIFIAWVIIVALTRYVSLASIVGAAMAPVLIWLFGEEIEFFVFGILAAAFVIFRHKANIQRLLKGEELKIKSPGAAREKKENDG
ncbi:MAG: plsY [Firmicutes bacterium]|nr:plsY [Bacillota bacterium]